MNKNRKISFLIPVLLSAGILLAGIFGCTAQKSTQENTQEQFNPITPSIMKLTSPAFRNNEDIPSKYTCDGENVNPPLDFSAIPVNAKSLVLILDDPDAPSGDFVHWTLWNIAPDTQAIPENSVPANAVQGMTSAGRNGWASPCPPTGVHHYRFKLYALDAVLDLPASATKNDLEQTIKPHILDQALLVGLYQRK